MQAIWTKTPQIFSENYFLILDTLLAFLQMVMELCAAGSVTDVVRMTRNQSLKEDWIAYICREILQVSLHIVIFSSGLEKTWK